MILTYDTKALHGLSRILLYTALENKRKPNFVSYARPDPVDVIWTRRLLFNPNDDAPAASKNAFSSPKSSRFGFRPVLISCLEDLSRWLFKQCVK